MHDELQRFLNGKPIVARPISSPARFARWCRRRPQIAASLFAVMITLLAGASVSGFFALLAFQRAEREEGARTNAESALQNANQQLYLNLMSTAFGEWEDADIGRVHELLRACPEDFRHWEWGFVQRLCRLDRFAWSSAGSEFAVSGDGRFVAVAHPQGEVEICDAYDGTSMFSLPGFPDTILFDRDAKLILLGHASTRIDSGQPISGGDGRAITQSFNRRCVIFDLESGAQLHSIPIPGGATVQALLDNGNRLIYVDNTSFNVYSVTGEDPRPRILFDGHAGVITDLDVSGNGRTIASASRDGTVRIWGPDRESPVLLSGHVGDPQVALMVDGSRVVTTSGEVAIVWDSRTGDRQLELRGHDGEITSLRVTADGNRIATGGLDRTARIWDSHSGRQLLVLRGHTHPIEQMAFFEEGNELVALSTQDVDTALPNTSSAMTTTGNSDPRQALVMTYDASQSHLAWTLRTERRSSGNWVIGNGGEHAISWSPDGSIRYWQANEGRELYRWSQPGMVSQQAFISDNGSTIASVSSTSITLWDYRGRELASHALLGNSAYFHEDLFGPGLDSIAQLALTADGQTAVIATDGGAILRCELLPEVTGRVLRSPPVDAETVFAYGYERDHLAIAAGSQVAVWGVTRNSRIVLRDDDAAFGAMYFSRDARRLFTVNAKRDLCVWDLQTKLLLRRIRTELRPGVPVGVSANGGRVAGVVGFPTDWRVLAWDATSGREILRLDDLESMVVDLDLSDDGQRLALATEDGTIMVFDVESGDSLLELTDASRNVQFGPTGETVYALDTTKVVTYDLAAGEPVDHWRVPDTEHDVVGIALSHDGGRFARASREHDMPFTVNLEVWDITAGVQRVDLQRTDFNFHFDDTPIHFEPGLTSAWFEREGDIFIWSIDGLTGAPPTDSIDYRMRPELSRIGHVAIDGKGRSVALAYHHSPFIDVLDVETGDEIGSLQIDRGSVSSLVFSPTGDRLFVGTDQGWVRGVNMELADWYLGFQAHEGPVVAIDLSEDGTVLATGSEEAELRTWDAWTGRQRGDARLAEASLQQIRLTPKGDLVVAADDQLTLVEIEARSHRRLIDPSDGVGNNAAVRRIRFSDDGRYLLLTSGNSSVWEVATRQRLSQATQLVDLRFRTLRSGRPGPTELLLSGPGGVSSVDVWGETLEPFFSPVRIGPNDALTRDEAFLAHYHGGNSVQLIRMSTGLPVGWLPENAFGLAFDPDDEWVVVSVGSSAQIFDLDSGEPLATLSGERLISQLTVAPDGKRIAAQMGDRVTIWSSATGEVEFTTPRVVELSTTSEMPKPRFDAAGEHLVIPRDHDLLVWEIAADWELTRMRHHNGPINDVAFTVDNRRLATASDDRSVIVWDWQSKMPLLQLDYFDAPVMTVQFSPDHRCLAATDSSGTIRIFESNLETIPGAADQTQ